MAVTRRSFLYGGEALAIVAALDRAYAHVPPEAVATAEEFWPEIRRAYVRDPELLNLNNGGVAPAPTSVMEAQIADIRYSNLAPAQRMWGELEPRIEDVRKAMARMWEADPKCIPITRNA